MKVKSESEIAQSCPTLSDPMDCNLPGSTVHGIFQARVLEWGAIAFSKLDGITYLMDMSLSKLWNFGDGQGSLACCSPWGLKELDTTEQLK